MTRRGLHVQPTTHTQKNHTNGFDLGHYLIISLYFGKLGPLFIQHTLQLEKFHQRETKVFVEVQQERTHSAFGQMKTQGTTEHYLVISDQQNTDVPIIQLP